MSIGVLNRLATEWASLHHVAEAELEFKVHIPKIDVGSGSHIGGGGDGELAESFFSAITSGTMGASELGFFTGRVAGGGTTRGSELLTSFSRFFV